MGAWSGCVTSRAWILKMESTIIIVVKMIQEVIPEKLDLSKAKDIFKSKTGTDSRYSTKMVDNENKNDELSFLDDE